MMTSTRARYFCRDTHLCPIMEHQESDDSSTYSGGNDSTLRSFLSSQERPFRSPAVTYRNGYNNISLEFPDQDNSDRYGIDEGDRISRFIVLTSASLLAIHSISFRGIIYFVVDHKVLFFLAMMLSILPFIWMSTHLVVYLREAVDSCCNGDKQAQEKHGKQAIMSMLLISTAFIMVINDVSLNHMVAYILDRKVLFFSVVMMSSVPLILMLPHLVVYLTTGDVKLSTSRDEQINRLTPSRSTAAQKRRRSKARQNRNKKKIAGTKKDPRVSPVSVCDL